MNSLGPVPSARSAPAEAKISSPHRSAAATARTRRRQLSERLFRAGGATALGIGLLFVVALFASIISHGHSAFWQTELRLDLDFSPATLGLGSSTPTPQELGDADYSAVIRESLARQFPEVVDRKERRELSALVSSGASYLLRDLALSDPSVLGSRRTLWLTADDEVDMFVKGTFDRATPEAERRIKDRQIFPILTSLPSF